MSFWSRKIKQNKTYIFIYNRVYKRWIYLEYFQYFYDVYFIVNNNYLLDGPVHSS